MKARQSAREDDSDGYVQPGGGKRARPPPGERDQTYTDAAEAAAAKKRARKDAYKIPDLAPPLADDPADGARGINTVCLVSEGGGGWDSPMILSMMARSDIEPW